MAEQRLIDANAFRQSLELDRFGYTNIVKVNIALDKSTVDAVEVVRCRDCRFWHRETISCEMNAYLGARERPCWYADDFCSYGERRTDNG